jgi:hypothetical protein
MSNNIKTAVLALNTSDDRHWTRAGLPDVNYLKHVLQVPLTRSVVNGAVPGLTRNTIDKIRTGKEIEIVPAVSIEPSLVPEQADLATCNAWSRKVHAHFTAQK